MTMMSPPRPVRVPSTEVVSRYPPRVVTTKNREAHFKARDITREDLGGAPNGVLIFGSGRAPPWRSLLRDIELMPQYHDLGFQLLSRLEAVAQHADEQEADCDHAAIMF
jgi:hypothetical protein